ncbi:MAG: ABC transporter permease subunit [Clostridiales bacterium]|nr:ABC transporter permease subunit [Clostridiales bacterium]
MNIVLRELKSTRRSLIIWCSSIIFLIYVGMVKYDGFSKAGESANEMLASLPTAMKAIFGIGDLDLALASGYYIVFLMYFVLLCGVHAIMQGSVVLSKEERDKTADFLLVKPVKRTQVLTSKIIASLINMVILNAITWITSILIVDVYNDGPPINDLISKLMIGLFITQLVFFSIGLLIGVLVRTTKKATNISTGFLLSTFILSATIDIYDKLDFLKYLTPFKYFDGKKIYLEGFSVFFIALSFIIVVLSVGSTYVLYKKKDLHV